MQQNLINDPPVQADSGQSGFAPYEIVEGDPASGILLMCDHASHALPSEYGSLGLDEKEFARHIAYDIGARAVTIGLAERLGYPAVMSTFSRLLIDPNRGEDDPTVIMKLSDGTVIPGNHPLDESERRHRIENFYQPYHQAVSAAIDRCFAAGKVPALFSVHSFTASWRGVARPWHVGFLWDVDKRLTEPFIEELSADDRLTVGDNEPYSGALRNDTMFRHGTSRGLAHTLIELRQDLVAGETGIREWVDRLAPILVHANGLAEMHEVRHFGSKTGPVEPEQNPPIGLARSA